MTGWKLNPAGVQGVLNATNAEAEGLGEFLDAEGVAAGRREAIMAGLGSEAAVLAPVFQAVQASLDAQAGSVRSISNRINAGVLGVLNVVVGLSGRGVDQRLARDRVGELRAALGTDATLDGV